MQLLYVPCCGMLRGDLRHDCESCGSLEIGRIARGTRDTAGSVDGGRTSNVGPLASQAVQAVQAPDNRTTPIQPRPMSLQARCWPRAVRLRKGRAGFMAVLLLEALVEAREDGRDRLVGEEHPLRVAQRVPPASEIEWRTYTPSSTRTRAWTRPSTTRS